MHSVARQFRVSVGTVSLWVRRCLDQRLDRAELGDRSPGRAWNRLSAGRERRILVIRRRLREHSVLGEYGARAIAAELQRVQQAIPSERTINRVLRRHGAFDGARRQRRPAPPKGWYLPLVAAGRADIDCFDFIEDLKIADGPLVSVLTAKSVHAVLSDAWAMDQSSAKATVNSLLERWRRDGLPAYAQFDNDTLFQGAHQFRDTVGRVSRLCLALGVTPVFVPPLEHGMQNTIESFNGYALLLHGPLGIPRHFPQMRVRVLEVACVTTPKGVVRWLYDNCTCPFGLFHYRVDVDFRGDVVPNGEIGRVWPTKSDPRIVSNTLSRPKRELQTGLQVEESDCAILKLCADNALGL